MKKDYEHLTLHEKKLSVLFRVGLRYWVLGKAKNVNNSEKEMNVFIEMVR